MIVEASESEESFASQDYPHLSCSNRNRNWEFDPTNHRCLVEEKFPYQNDPRINHKAITSILHKSHWHMALFQPLWVNWKWVSMNHLQPYRHKMPTLKFKEDFHAA